MAFTQLTNNLNIIQTLDKYPNANDGLSYTQLQAKFDEASNLIKTYLNSTLLNELSSTVDGSSGADNIGATAINDLTGTTIQALLESLRNNLKSTVDGSSGADFVNATAIDGLSGTTVQALLEAINSALTAHKSSSDHDGRYYTETELNNGQLDNRYFTETELSSTTDNSSGADKIGATAISGSPTTVQGILEWLKTQIDNTTLGQIPDGSLTTVKFSDTAITNAKIANSTITNAKISNDTITNSNLGTDIKVGSLSSLTTTAKSSIVEAINEHDSEIGTLSSLTTTTKSSLVGAVNEHDGEIGTLSTLTTTEKGSLVGAVNEVKTGVENVKERDGRYRAEFGVKNMVYSNTRYIENDTVETKYGTQTINQTNASVTTSQGFWYVNNGRKIVSNKYGLFTVFVNNSSPRQIVCLKSTDGGSSWSDISFPTIASYNQSYPSIVTDSNGDLHVVWNGRDATYTSNSQIKYSKYTQSTKSWSNITNITGYAYESNTPSIAIDSSNNLHVAWPGNNITYTTSEQIFYSKRTTSWSAPIIVNSSPSNTYRQLDATIEVDLSNNIHVAWNGRDATYTSGYQVKYAKSTNGGSSFSTSVIVNSSPNDSYSQQCPSIAFDSSSNIHIAWHGTDSTYTTGTQIKYSKSTNGGSTWATSVIVDNTATNAYSQYNPNIEIDSSNKIFIYWGGSNNTGYSQIRYTSSTDNGSTWASTTNLTTSSTNKSYLSICLTINTFTNPVMVWLEGTGTLTFYGNASFTQYTYETIVKKIILTPEATSGTAIKTFTPYDLATWGNVEFDKATPTNTTLQLDILSNANNVIKSNVTSVGDLSDISVSTHPTIKARWTLTRTANTISTPFFGSPSLTWEGMSRFREKIIDTTLTFPASSVTLTIPEGNSFFTVIVIASNTTSASSPSFIINNDTSANYSYVVNAIKRDATTTLIGTGTNTGGSIPFNGNAMSTVLGEFSAFIDFVNIPNATKSGTIRAYGLNANISANHWGSFYYNSTANITSVKINTGGNNFAIGSRFMVVGVE